MQDHERFRRASFFSKYFQKASMIIRFIQQCKPNGGWSKSLQPICFLSRNELNYQVYHHTVNHQSHILEYLVAPPFVLQARRHCVSLESCWTLPNSESLPKITKRCLLSQGLRRQFITHAKFARFGIHVQQCVVGTSVSIVVDVDISCHA